MKNSNKILILVAISVLAGIGLTYSIKKNTNLNNEQKEVVIETETNETTQATDSIKKPTNMISMEEITKHIQPSDCWIAVDGKVYDVSNFGEKHGGGKTVYEGCGKDATILFETRPMGSKTPHSQKARGFLPNFYIGDLAK